jgi:hypothetical protein
MKIKATVVNDNGKAHEEDYLELPDGFYYYINLSSQIEPFVHAFWVEEDSIWEIYFYKNSIRGFGDAKDLAESVYWQLYKQKKNWAFQEVFDINEIEKLTKYIVNSYPNCFKEVKNENKN